MTATGHSIVGAAIASQIPNPFISIPIAFLSHFALDKVPHWDTMVNKEKSKTRVILETIADVLLGFSLVALFFVFFRRAENPINLFLAAFAAQLPDWLEAPRLFPQIHGPLKLIADYSYRIQSYLHDLWFDSRLEAPWGIVTQIVVVLFFLAWALR